MPKIQEVFQQTVVVSTVEKTSKPALYRVFFLNDDYTPFDFVIEVLRTLYAKTDHEAQYLTMQIHVNGRAMVGVYSRDCAQTLARITRERARAQGHPLEVTVEKIP